MTELGVATSVLALIVFPAVAGLIWLFISLRKFFASLQWPPMRSNIDVFGLEEFKYVWLLTVERVLHPSFLLEIIRLVVGRWADLAAG
jgi:hypothetical protein